MSSSSQPGNAIALARRTAQLQRDLYEANEKLASLRQELTQAEHTAKVMSEKHKVADREAKSWRRRYRELEARRSGFEEVPTVGVGREDE